MSRLGAGVCFASIMTSMIRRPAPSVSSPSQNLGRPSPERGSAGPHALSRLASIYGRVFDFDMIRLTYAHRWTALTDVLAEQIRATQARYGPLEPQTVIVPHPVAAAFIKIAVADRIHIAANLQLTYLRPFVVQAYERRGDHRLFTPPRLEQLLLCALEDVQRPDLTPVRRYLEAEGPVDRRRAQLATTLARLFDDYMLTRPDMLTAWSNGDIADDDDGTAAWQAALWRRVRDIADGLTGAPLRTLDELIDAPADIPETLFVFDVQLGAPVLQGVLARWAEVAHVDVYATNPCMEFWEDLPAGGRAARKARGRLAPRNEGGWSDPTDAADPVPLVLWGRPARENVRHLNALTDCDFDGRFGTTEAEPGTILARLQHDILRRQGVDAELEAALPDESVSIVACPGARREAETIVESIWARVSSAADTDTPLSFGDIGIVLAGRDADAYRSHLAAVFEEYHQVPHHFIDVPVARASRVVEAVELLLALPTSRFTRQDILRLATHPTVVPNEDTATAAEWIAWCEDLAIVHGADRSDHEGTYIESDLLNWNQGLTRLALGLFMASDDETPVLYAKNGSRYPPHDVPLDRTDSAARFITLVRSLIADARYFASASLSQKEWMSLLRGAISAYITPRDERDERDLLRVLSVLERVELDDLTGTTLSYPVVQEVVRVALGDLTENIGQPLADGVMVAPLRLAASLPLKVVYMPGLHEGAFPIPDLQSSLDVRRFARRPTEISPRERDQYHFLARLMATEQQICLSYVARDAATGEARAPAPTLVELMQILTPYVAADVDPHLVERPPLRRYASAAHPFASSAAEREISTYRLAEALAAHQGRTSPRIAGPRAVELDAVRGMLSPDAWRKVSERLRWMPPPADEVALPDTVTLRALRMFLEDPLQGWAQHALGLRSEEDDTGLLVTDERFQTGPLETHVLLRSVLLEAHRNGERIEDVYAQHSDRLEVIGTVPTGLFKRADRQRHLQTLVGWQRALRRVFSNRPRPFDPIRFGRSAAAAPNTRMDDAIDIPLPSGPIELRGTTLPSLDEPPASIVVKVGPKPSGGPPTHELGAFIDHAARSATGEVAGRPYTVWTIYGDGEAVRTRFEPFDRQDATAYLARLIAELRTVPHGYLLPFGAVHRAHLQGDGSDDGWAPILAAIRPARFGPLAGLEAPIPEAQAAQRILTERYGAFYRRRTEGGGP